MIEVTCAIILKEDMILAAQRSESMKLPCKWEFPGGKIEKNESAESCLQREIREELNIEIKIIKKLNPVVYSYDFATIKLIPFLVKYISGELTLSEHKGYNWFEKEELIFLDWAAADRPVLNEFLKLNYDSTRPLRATYK